MEQLPAIRPGAIVGGRYELVEEIGRGAFGVVWKAKDVRLRGKWVAVKMLLERALATPDAVRRFRTEAELLCDVQHAHVPAVLDIGEFAGQQYIVFAFVHGKTVRDLIPPGGYADVVAAVRIAAKLTRTLHDIYAAKSILHRDVKPANMMIPQGEQGGLYLMDFGLAVCHDTDETRTTDGTILGTPWYMAPEQAEGRIKEIGHTTDLYGAAAVLYHLLTGRPPFNTRGLAVLAEIRFVPPQPPSIYRAGLDSELDEIVIRGLNKRSEDRYRNGAEFAERLELWAARATLKVPKSTPVAVAPGSPGHGSSTHNPIPGVRPTATPHRTSLGEASSVVSDSTVGAPLGPLPPDPRVRPRPVQTSNASIPQPNSKPQVTSPQVAVKPLIQPLPQASSPNQTKEQVPLSTTRGRPSAESKQYRSLVFKLGVLVVALALLAGSAFGLYSVLNPDGKKTTPTSPVEVPTGGKKDWYGK